MGNPSFLTWKQKLLFTNKSRKSDSLHMYGSRFLPRKKKECIKKDMMK